MAQQSLHTFHIPVMGTGFTVDTPLKVAPWGVDSVISLVDDVLIEQMRKYYCEKYSLPYTEISNKEEDARAKRITAYLDMLDDLINSSFNEIINSPLEEGSPFWQFMELLPAGPVKDALKSAVDLPQDQQQDALREIRSNLAPGSIDVNIMTKLDGVPYVGNTPLDSKYSYGQAALRGFSESKVGASVVLSAGMNPRLFDMFTKYEDYKPNTQGLLKKKVVLKVSDFRSAMLQGRMLARKGIWVSEFRVESGLNCGGHAFASKGNLMGPILEEFKEGRTKLLGSLYDAFQKAGGGDLANPYHKLTVQGGIGTAEEDQFLREYYGMDGTGWGSPFMLVPEAVNIEPRHLQLLEEAGTKDIYLSAASPLGVPFWNVYGSDSELKRLERISENHPGAPCSKGFLALNNEFGEKPLCTASRLYQKQKLESLNKEGHTSGILARLKEDLLAKACICHDLAGTATKTLGIDKLSYPAMTPGPNLAYFKKGASFKEMIGHIYGRINLLKGIERPHMLLKELELYLNYLKKLGEDVSLGILEEGSKLIKEFRKNLDDGMVYYQKLANSIAKESQKKFLNTLNVLKKEFDDLCSSFEQLGLVAS